MASLLDVIGKLIDIGEKIIRLIKRFPKATLAIAAIVASITTFVIGSHSKSPLPNSGPSPSRSPAAVHTKIDKGGVDLAGYCESYRLKVDGEEFCNSTIDLSKACNWQYEENDLHAKSEPGNLYSAECYPPHGKSRGGIKDMSGYCMALFKSSVGIDAAIVDGKWKCKKHVDMKLVCSWMYQASDAEPHLINGNWHCFA